MGWRGKMTRDSWSEHRSSTTSMDRLERWREDVSDVYRTHFERERTWKHWTLVTSILFSCSMLLLIVLDSPSEYRRSGIIVSTMDENAVQMSFVSLPTVFRNAMNARLHIAVWVNLYYWMLYSLYRILVYYSFGDHVPLMASQNVYDRVVQYTLFKIVFVGAILEVPELEEALLWMFWFSFFGMLRVLTKLASDRYEYVRASGTSFYPPLVLGWIATCMGLMATMVSIHLFHPVGVSLLLLINFESLMVAMETIRIHVLSMQDATTLYPTDTFFSSFILLASLSHYIHILYIHGISFSLTHAVLLLHVRSAVYQLRQKRDNWKKFQSLVVQLYQYPLVPFSKDMCAICRDTYGKGRYLGCGHVFHQDCLIRWMEAHETCPTCRVIMKDAKIPHNWVETLKSIFPEEEEDVLREELTRTQSVWKTTQNLMTHRSETHSLSDYRDTLEQKKSALYSKAKKQA